MPAVARKSPEKPFARFSWDELSAWIVHRQHLDERAPAKTMLDVVGDICGLHAQLMSSAELTLWARVVDLDAGAVRQALWDDRSLAKTWAMRGTLHLLPADEFSSWQAALRTYDHFRKPQWLKYFKITAKELDRLIDEVGRALYDNMLTREELAKAVTKATRSKKLGEHLRQSWGSMLKPAAFAGNLCFAPSVGQNVRFTNPRSWLSNFEEGAARSSLLEVVGRYLSAFGPAAREDLARWWAGVSPAQALKLIRELGGDVVPVDVGDERMWMLANDAKEMGGLPKLRRSVRLLPAFDQFVVNVSRRSQHLMPGPFKARIYRKSAWLSPVVLVNGRMDGVWGHEKKGNRLVVTIDPFIELPGWARKSVEQEAQTLAAFMDKELDLAWNSP